jgi:hypothetical protein
MLTKKVFINVLVIALWFGLVAGLLERVGSLFLHSLGRMPGVWLEILWVSPLFDALLFGALGVTLTLPYFIFPRLPVITLAVFLFAFFTFSIWLGLALPWQVHTIALLILSAGVAAVFTRWFRHHQTATLRFWRGTLPVAAATTLLVFLGVQGSFWFLERKAIADLPPASADSPNILLIVIDALRPTTSPAMAMPAPPALLLMTWQRRGCFLKAPSALPPIPPLLMSPCSLASILTSTASSGSPGAPSMMAAP